LPVDLVVGDGRIAAGVKDEVLLEENDKAVLDLPAIQVGGASDSCESLSSMTCKYCVDALPCVSKCAEVCRMPEHEQIQVNEFRADKFPDKTYRCKFAVDVADQKGAELRKDLESVGYDSCCWRRCAVAATAYRSLALSVRHVEA
jgi:hypothetical protein